MKLEIAAAVRELTSNQAINEALRLEMRRDPTIIIMGEDIAGGAGLAHLGFVDSWGGSLRTTKGLITEFGPERVIDTPIVEMGFVGAPSAQLCPACVPLSKSCSWISSVAATTRSSIKPRKCTT